MDARHGTLTPGVVYQYEVAPPMMPGAARVELINRSGTGEIWFTVDGTEPTVGGDDVMVVPAVVGSYVFERLTRRATLKMLSTVAQDFSVLVG